MTAAARPHMHTSSDASMLLATHQFLLFQHLFFAFRRALLSLPAPALLDLPA